MSDGDNNICRDHSGMCAEIINIKEDLVVLFEKWDKVQTLLIGTLVSTCLSLLGVVFLLLRTT